MINTSMENLLKKVILFSSLIQRLNQAGLKSFTLCKAGIHFTQPPLVDHERTAHLISPPSDATAAHDTIRDKISYW